MWTILLWEQTYKVSENLIGLNFRKCPVVCILRFLQKAFLAVAAHKALIFTAKPAQIFYQQKIFEHYFD